MVPVECYCRDWTHPAGPGTLDALRDRTVLCHQQSPSWKDFVVCSRLAKIPSKCPSTAPWFDSGLLPEKHRDAFVVGMYRVRRHPGRKINSISAGSAVAQRPEFAEARQTTTVRCIPAMLDGLSGPQPAPQTGCRLSRWRLRHAYPRWWGRVGTIYWRASAPENAPPFVPAVGRRLM